MHYFKYILRGLKNNISRFIAVIAIVALGIGFLVGLMSSSSDIYASINNNYNMTNVMDFNLKSTIGFSSQSIDLIKKSDNLDAVSMLQIESSNTYVNKEKLESRMINYSFSSSRINQLTLKEGRYPSRRNECVVLENNGSYYKTKIGDIIKFNNEDIDISENYEIVGIVSSPIFFTKEREYNLTGTSKLDLIFYTDLDYNDYGFVTDIFVVVNNIKKERFKDTYFDKIKKYKDILISYSDDLFALRKDEIVSEIKNTIIISIEEEMKNNLKNYGLSDDEIENQIKNYLLLNADEINKKALDIFEQTYTDLDTIYVLDLKSNQSYLSLSQNTQKIDRIAVVFPVFFFFIAALVSLTTMTRLIEEERTEIGLLKSLGYSKSKIIFKYVFYSMLCALFGSILGSLCGNFVLPYVIHMAFGTLYSMAEPVYIFNISVNIISILIMLLTILFVTFAITYKSLHEKPAALLMPKAPKSGKRILLEKISFIWKRISFKYKNTLRNIFRYKKNFFMMIIGISGCVALLLCAFSIKDSFTLLSGLQYHEILTYDMKVTIDKNSNIDDVNGILDYQMAYVKTVNLDNDDYSINRIITKANLDGYFNIRNTNKNKIDFKPGDVIIDKQLSLDFKIKIGDTISFDDLDGTYVVTGICENHISNYIFIYDMDYNDELNNTCYLHYDKKIDEEVIIENLLNNNILSIEAISQASTMFDSMLDSIGLIIIVVIICSGALAIIVIYNLTNININERVREIATLKVLGYQTKEVCGYIYREIFILTFIGILCGFIIGPLLFNFIIYNLHSPGLFFTNYINPLYFLYAFIITLVFALVVAIIFIKKIKNIKMVESLKQVD
ncbi:MAG: FtsX-like permease family protein [Anaeroplasma sp.]